MRAPVRPRLSARVAVVPVMLPLLAIGLGVPACKDSGGPTTPLPTDGSVIESGGATGGAGGNPGGAGGAAGAPAAISRADVVKAIGACTLTVYKAFIPAAEELATATAALAAEGTANRLTAARAALTRAMERWQEAEQFQYGPLDSPDSPGGKGMRDNFYAWPFASRCAVDQELVNQGFKDATFPTTSLINARGLAAAEYLLFHEGVDNGCAPTASINGGPWMTLAATPAELAKRKRDYAAVVAADVLQRARTLVDAWEPGKGNFLGQVETAGDGSMVYSSAQAALNAQSDALFYIENPTKDLKLGKPLGLKECAAATCPQDLESRYALRSKTHLQRNLDGFEKLFAGCDAGALGFADLLVASNAGELAATLTQRLEGVRTALSALPGEDLTGPLTSTPAEVRAIYDAYKALTDILRSQFISVLNLQLPKDIQTDND